MEPKGPAAVFQALSSKSSAVQLVRSSEPAAGSVLSSRYFHSISPENRGASVSKSRERKSK